MIGSHLCKTGKQKTKGQCERRRGEWEQRHKKSDWERGEFWEKSTRGRRKLPDLPGFAND